MESLTIGSTVKNGQISESDLSYTPPAVPHEDSLKDAGEEFIKTLLAGGDISALKFGDDEEGGAGEESDPNFPSELESEVEDTDETDDSALRTPTPDSENADEVEDPREARGVQRVIQRELAAKAREDAAAAREARAEARIAELKKYEALKPTADLAEQFEVDPLGAIKALGKDPDHFMKLALAAHLGENAPDVLKDYAKDLPLKRRLAELEARDKAREQERVRAEYFNTVSTGAREYVTKSVGDVGFLKKAPTLSQAAKADPQYVHDEIMEEIVKEARVRAATDPDGEPISYEEAAARVEKRLARIAKLISVQSTNRNGAPIVQKPRNAPPSTKQPAKPLAPWQQRSSDPEEEGWKVAMRVYEEEEAKRKQSRR